MSVPYDVFTDAFLSKITEYDFVNMRDFERNGLIDGYMKRAINVVCVLFQRTGASQNVECYSSNEHRCSISFRLCTYHRIQRHHADRQLWRHALTYSLRALSCAFRNVLYVYS